MGDIEADPVGLQHLADCCRRHQECVASDTHDHAGGPKHQPTAAAVTAIYDGIAAAPSTLGERLGATADRVSAANANYMAAESASASTLHALADGVD